MKKSRNLRNKRTRNSAVVSDSRVDREAERSFVLSLLLTPTIITTLRKILRAITSYSFDKIFSFSRIFSILCALGRERMVLKRGKEAICDEGLAAQRAVDNMHKMQWLKHQNNPERRDSKDDEMSNVRNGNKMGRKPRGKNTKPVNGQKHHGRYSLPAQQASNAWEDGNRTAADLFAGMQPATHLAQEIPEEEDDEMRQAIEASIISMKESMTITEANKDAEEAEGRTDDIDYWSGKVLQNLPSPVSEQIQKTSDTNNNSSAGKPSVSRSATKPDRPADNSFARPQSSRDDEIPRGVEKGAIEVSDKLLCCAPSGQTHVVDRFNRIDGQNERHMFMGPGARKKEQQYLRQQQQEVERQQQQHQLQQATSRPSNETPPSQQETNRHDSSRTNQQYSTRGSRISQTPSRRPPPDVPTSRPFSSDKYHYVKDQSRPHPEHAERQTSGDHQKRDIPEKVLTRGSSTAEVLAKGLESPARGLPVDGKPRPAEVSSSSQIEKNGESGVNTDKVLRLQGFNSRFNTSVNEELLDSPKAQTEVGSASSACFEPRKNHSTVVEPASAWKAETPRCSIQPPPGFSGPQLRPANNYPPNYEPQASNVYERLAIHDPSLYRLLQQRQNGICRQGQAVAKDNFTVHEDYWRRDGAEESSSFATQETQVSACEKEESSNDYAIETHPPTYFGQFVPDERQFLDDSRPDSNFVYANEEAPLGYDPSIGYPAIATKHPGGCIYVSQPYQQYHGPVAFQPPFENWLIPELHGNEHLVPPETPRLQPRCAVSQYCTPPPQYWYHQDMRQEAYYPHVGLEHEYGAPIRSQPRFPEQARFPNNRVLNLPGNRGLCRPPLTGSRGIPLNFARGARRPHGAQQRYVPDTRHGRGKV